MIDQLMKNFFDIICSWWCHFDDDNYVHVEQLVNLLEQYSPSKSFYLGKTSTAKPLEIFDDSNSYSVSYQFTYI